MEPRCRQKQDSLSREGQQQEQWAFEHALLRRELTHATEPLGRDDEAAARGNKRYEALPTTSNEVKCVEGGETSRLVYRQVNVSLVAHRYIAAD
jgi:hypothetical protein